MKSFTIGDIERAIYDLGEHFGQDFDGLTNGECVGKLRELCPLLHSDEELKKHSQTILEGVENKYTFDGLRVWYTTHMYHSFFTNEMMMMKYHKLLQEINEYINEYLELNKITLKLDVFLLSLSIKETYKEKYVVFDTDKLMDLYSLLRAIHLSNYNQDVINGLQHTLEICLWMHGDNYYSEMDLSTKSVLERLYIHVGEEMGDEYLYQGHNMFKEYDGYGGVLFSL